MLYILVVGLSALASARAVPQQKRNHHQRLVAHNDAGCYTDEDCGNNQYCGDNGHCENGDTICYGDDECRGRQVCDMGSYICKDPTPSPKTPAPTEPAGCCYGDSYKANDKCTKALSQDKCEDKGCRWKVTEDPEDCDMTTTSTPTTTQEVGCCKGDSSKTNSMCNARDTRVKCEKSSSCHFIEGGEVHDECAFPATEAPEDPGCCYGNPDAAYSKRWMDTCTAYYAERECLFNTDDDGNYRCSWQDLGEYMDCEMLWPTTTTTTVAPGCCRGSSYKAQAKCYGIEDQVGCERKDCEWVETDEPSDCVITTESPTTTTTTTEEPGCCAGDSSKSTPLCNAREGRERCEKSSSCHFVSGGDVEVDCAWKETEAPEDPGCCYGNPDAAYSKRWMDTCTAYYTERECLFNTDDSGNNRCAWEDLVEGYDCSQLWPTTTTTTTTLAPGCCRGSSYKAQSKCFGLEDQVGCERKDCEWVETDDPNDCVITTTTTTTTTTTEEPGCCKGDSMAANDKCNTIDNGDKCDARSSCHWISFGVVDVHCIWEPTEAPEDPGCCYGNPDIAYSKKWMESCTEFYSEDECTMLTNGDGHARCVWEPLGEYMDCEMLWPTTTTTTLAPGCCRGSSYKAQAKCYGIADQVGCERKDCEWVETDEPNDCVITTTTTTTTTTTEQPGCCKGSSRSANDKCNEIDNDEQCDKRSSCHWISFGQLTIDCVYPATEPPEDPGCCYGNPDVAYSKRWMESCTEFYTERDCVQLTDGGGAPRCVWEPMGEYEDCEMLWPTTTSTPTEAPGCCRGSSYKAQSKCFGLEDQVGCERKDCEWVETDDPNDCVITTETPTTTTTTTEQPGCCKGDSMAATDKCNTIDNGDKCDARSSCHWIPFGVVDVHCIWDPTEAPEEPGCCYGNPDIAYSKRWMESCTEFYSEAECTMLTNGDGHARCVWEPMGEYEDCSMLWPTTTETPTTTEGAGCCYGEGAKANEMCGKKESEIQCVRSNSCEWREGEHADCTFTPTTTTSEPWLGAKADAQNAVLFGEGAVLGEAMNTQVSLSSVLLVAIVALAAQQLYRWWNASRDGNTKLTAVPQQGRYQSA